MNILSISFTQSKVKDINLLNWLTSPEINKGVNHERYWLINTDVQINTAAFDINVESFKALLHLCQVFGHNALQIIKNV